VYKRAPSQATVLLSGTSSKLDKSVLIGTLPLTSPAVAKSLTDTGWDLCIQRAAMQATAAVIGTSSKLDKSVLIGPLTRAPLLRILTGYWIGTCVYSLQPGRQQLLLSGTSSKLDKSVLIGTLPLT
jgi:hypothetical protein